MLLYGNNDRDYLGNLKCIKCDKKPNIFTWLNGSIKTPYGKKYPSNWYTLFELKLQYKEISRYKNQDRFFLCSRCGKIILEEEKIEIRKADHYNAEVKFFKEQRERKRNKLRESPQIKNLLNNGPEGSKEQKVFQWFKSNINKKVKVEYKKDYEKDNNNL